jgi:adenylate cyclase
MEGGIKISRRMELAVPNNLTASTLGHWPTERRAVLDWLANETAGQRFLDNLLVEMSDRLLDDDVPVERVSMHLRIRHPQWQGARILWRSGMTEAQIDTFDHNIDPTKELLRAPASEIYNGVQEVRQRLWHQSATNEQFPLFSELSGEGFTDYVAWPIEHTLGKRHVVAFATKRAYGFTDQHVSYLRDILPALAFASEIRMNNAMTRTLLETYVGPHASEEILAGATTRGSGKTVNAAIMICDLRDFTALSDLWPRDDVIEVLNSFFDALCEPIEKRGGEILKFMGDGLLAIFPLSDPAACANLLDAIEEGLNNIVALNQANSLKGKPLLRHGVGVHVGDVMYGNIGSRKRLDFTVIGPAVNVASRLEELTKHLGHPVLMSQAFVGMAAADLKFESVGLYPLRGLQEPVDVFALAS